MTITTDAKTSTRRLLKLANFLEQLSRERFDYAHWVGGDWKGAIDLSCGTTACAGGWATTMPEFRRLGLFLNRFHDVALVGRTDHDPIYALSTVFKITDNQAFFLFSPGAEISQFAWVAPSNTATPKQVAAHIRRFIRTRAKTLGVDWKVAA